MSNYEKMKQKMQGEFLKCDQEKMIQRFHMANDAQYLYFDFLGEPCRVSRTSGRVECWDLRAADFAEADYNEAMTVYDLLCWSKSDAAPSGQFVSMDSLAGLYSTSPGSNSGFFQQQARQFDHQEALLGDALRKLGGMLTEGGDVAARMPVFAGLEVLVRFWNSDDEFQPELQFFWDADVLSYMHYETVWFTNHALVSRVQSAMREVAC